MTAIGGGRRFACFSVTPCQHCLNCSSHAERKREAWLDIRLCRQSVESGSSAVPWFFRRRPGLFCPTTLYKHLHTSRYFFNTTGLISYSFDLFTPAPSTPSSPSALLSLFIPSEHSCRRITVINGGSCGFVIGAIPGLGSGSRPPRGPLWTCCSPIAGRRMGRASALLPRA